MQILNEMIHPLDSKDLLPQGVRSGRGFREISWATPFYNTCNYSMPIIWCIHEKCDSYMY